MKGLPIWTVYENPSDHPGKFVARLWDGDEPTDQILIAEDIGRLRRIFERWGLHCLQRRAGDDPVIVETWL